MTTYYICPYLLPHEYIWEVVVHSTLLEVGQVTDVHIPNQLLTPAKISDTPEIYLTVSN